VNIWIELYGELNSSVSLAKLHEKQQRITRFHKALLGTLNLDLEQDDSVATLPVFIQSP
jgi:hypothetical protein